MDKKRTIKAPGTNVSRVSVACDRCRKKKIRCFYDDKGGEICANCKVVGLECIFTDKLARKAFPRGYTESLEERIRVLEHENKKLQKMIELREEMNEENGNGGVSGGGVGGVGGGGGGSGVSELNSENILKLGHEENCNCGMHGDSVINRPVSIAGSVDIDNGYLSDNGSLLSINEVRSPENKFDSNTFYFKAHSFEQINAPGAVAAVNLERKLQRKNFYNLANLIAAAVPRSTEETLYLPTLLAKIVETHGFNSKAPYLTARTIALLKQAHNEEDRYKIYSNKLRTIEFDKIREIDSILFFEQLNLPNKVNLDLCIEVYFKTWNNLIPILDREKFMKEYEKFCVKRDLGFKGLIGEERIGEILIIIVCLVVSQEGGKESYEIVHYYDYIIKEIIKSNLNDKSNLSSLRSIIMELIYCLKTDDLTVSYSLRGKMVSMCQQLRLHRCPAAVLGSKGDKVSLFLQGERRVLFWCIYIVDVIGGMILGVPRLLKDNEIECALPSSRKIDKESIRFNGEFKFGEFKLELVGKVSEDALKMMRFSQVLGSIIDFIFKRSGGIDSKEIVSMAERNCLILENMLEEWRIKAGLEEGVDENELGKLDDASINLKYIYYLAKGLIYMPLLSGSNKKGSNGGNIGVLSATNAILRIWKYSINKGIVISLPLNSSKGAARQVLLAAGGALDHTRGGSLFQSARDLSEGVVNFLQRENSEGRLGCLSDLCVRVLKEAVEAIMGRGGAPGATPGAAPGLAPGALATGVASTRVPLVATHKPPPAPTAPTTAPAAAPVAPPPSVAPITPAVAALNDIFSEQGGATAPPAPGEDPHDYGLELELEMDHDMDLVAVDASLGLPFLAFDELDEPPAPAPALKRPRVQEGAAAQRGAAQPHQPQQQQQQRQQRQQRRVDGLGMELGLELDLDLDLDLELELDSCGLGEWSSWGKGA